MFVWCTMYIHMYQEILYCNTYTKTISKFFFNSKIALNEWLRNKIVPLIIFWASNIIIISSCNHLLFLQNKHKLIKTS